MSKAITGQIANHRSSPFLGSTNQGLGIALDLSKLSQFIERLKFDLARIQ